MPQYMRQGYGKMLIDFSKWDCYGLSSASCRGNGNGWVSSSQHTASEQICGQNWNVLQQLGIPGTFSEYRTQSPPDSRGNRG